MFRLETNPDEMNPVLNPSVFLGPVVTTCPDIVSVANDPRSTWSIKTEQAVTAWSKAPVCMGRRGMVETVSPAEAGKRVRDASDAYWVAKAWLASSKGGQAEVAMTNIIAGVEREQLDPANPCQVGAWRDLVEWIYTAKEAVR